MEVKKKILGSQFLGSLFDFSFSEFITIKIIRVLYGLGLVVSALIVLFLTIVVFDQSTLKGILTLIFIAPPMFLVGALLCRIYLEILIVIFRISEDVHEILNVKKQ